MRPAGAQRRCRWTRSCLQDSSSTNRGTFACATALVVIRRRVKPLLIPGRAGGAATRRFGFGRYRPATLRLPGAVAIDLRVPLEYPCAGCTVDPVRGRGGGGCTRLYAVNGCGCRVDVARLLR